MANFNKVILAGNLTRDPQLSYTPNNTPVCEFGMAINRRWRGQDGEQRESTCFVDCRSYGRQGETLNQYMSKGRPLLVEGRLDYQQWETPEGQKRSRHMVIVERFEFLGGGRGGDAGPGGGARSSEGYGGGSRSAPPAPAGQTSGPAPVNDAPPAAERVAGPSPANDAPPPPADSDLPF